jgi:hypothetical protein
MALKLLSYEIVWASANFRVTPPVTSQTLGDFDCEIEGNILTARPQDATYPTEAAGRASLEPHLRAWELQLELEYGYRVEFRTKGSSAEEPKEDGRREITAGINENVGCALDSVSAIVTQKLPPPTVPYKPGPLTIKYRGRLRDVLAGRDKVPGAAYAILDDLEAEYSAKGGVCCALMVSDSLRKEINKVAGRRHPTAWRKTVPNAPQMTDADMSWLTRAMTRLVRRVAEVESGVDDLPLLTKADI